MKSSKKKLLALILSILIVLFFLVYYNKNLQNYIENNYNSGILNIYNNDIKDKGTSLLNNPINNNDILLLGSSELSSPVEQNARRLFPNNYSDKVLAITGAPHVQSLINAIKLGSLDVNEKSNIVVIISPQWFMTDEIDIDGFNSNFSKTQYLKLMENNLLSDNLKNKIATRVSKLTSNTTENLDINIHARLYDRNILSKIFTPFYKANNAALTLKDNFQSSKLTKEYNGGNSPPIKDFNWTELKSNAEDQGASSISNPFMIEDDYYKKFIEPNLDNLKDRDSSITFENSNEFIDFEILLDLCSELNIKPYFIFASTNGYYYDYTGLSETTRASLYSKLEESVEKRNFDYLNLKDYEYEKYFYYDSMHLGWKGWLYISEEISKHFK